MKGFEPWDAKAASYEAIGERIKATGAKSIYSAASSATTASS